MSMRQSSARCEHFPLILIGGGPSGLLAALAVAPLGSKACILERQPSLGGKIPLTGGGQCNISHGGPVEDLLPIYGPEGKLLRPAFQRFSHPELAHLLEEAGLSISEEPLGSLRFYPVSRQARDVQKTLTRLVEATGITIRTETCVTGLEILEEGGFKLQTSTGITYTSEAVVITTGNGCYALSKLEEKYGSSDPFPWLEEAGIPLTTRTATICPLDCQLLEKTPLAELAGITLPHVQLTIQSNGKTIERRTGSLLLTHHGVSGPIILNTSRASAVRYRDQLAGRSGSHKLNLLPDLDPDTLLETINRLCQEEPKAALSQLPQLIQRALPALQIAATAGSENKGTEPLPLLPQRFWDALLLDLGLDREQILAHLAKTSRHLLCQHLTQLELQQPKPAPLPRAMQLLGGVDNRALDPQTLGFKKIPGLFVAGDLLECSGECGGYSLLAAFSSGHLAGESALAYLETKG